MCDVTSGCSIAAMLRLRVTHVYAVRNVLGNVYLSSISGTKSVSNLILAVEVRCHKVKGMTEAFTDTLYSRAKTSSSVHQKAIFTAFLERDSRDYAIKKSFHHALHLVTAYLDPLPESSCSRSEILVSELKYRFPNTFRTVRARVSRNLKYCSEWRNR